MTALPRILAAPALAAMIAFAGPAAAQMNPQAPTLTANGTGTVYVVPDIAIVSIGVATRAATAAEALSQNSAEMAQVIATIEAEGVARRDIGTTGFQVYPVYEQQQPPTNGNPTEPPRVVGYQVSNEVRVTIRDLASSGAILDHVVSAGANQVNGISFDSSDRQGPADAALADAVADARRQAEIMAAAAGVRLVRIVNVSASSNMPMFARAEMMAMDAAVPVMPGQREVSANATVTWEIAPE